MNIMNQKGEHALHAVIVPTPAQGHVNALMNLAQLLAIRGVFVTFVNTEWIHERVVEASKKGKSLVSKDNLELEQQGWRIRFLSIPDGLPPNHGRTSNGAELMVSLQKLGPALEDLLSSAQGKSPSFPPITFIVTDAFMSCTEQVATNMSVPRVIFWPLCAAASVSQCYANFLVSEGFIPVNVSEAKNPEKLIICLPGNIPPLKPTDLLSFYRAQDPSDILFKAFLYESQKQSKGDYILVNTFEELEGKDAVTALSLNGSPALAIGPLFLSNFLEGRDSCSSLWEEEECCLTWLDMQQPGSVIYVSFGSIAVKSEQQLEQVALGLEGSGQPFLWVLRLDIAEGQAAILPEGFEERTKKRALFVRWAPQAKVLAHASVGLFLTHSGWNSTLESMSMGVPVVGFPYFGDQFLNCRFAKEVWKIGLDFEDVDLDDQKVVMKEEVEGVLRRMMSTPEGKKMRDNVLRLKESAAKAVLPGGSSFLNLNTFVKDMTMSKGLQSKNETM
uniref:Glycosyltransferase n=1 Tax=Picea sitchensis TaxID=3332 RepID=B8LN73_PICSI|nr:unknown [Picea sitchensis]